MHEILHTYHFWAFGEKIFTDIWDNGGREMAQEIIQKSEKGIHDARKVAEAAEKSTEPEGKIGIN